MSKEEDVRIEIVCGALVGLGVIALVQMLSVTTLDVPLRISLCSFAISIPSLTAVFLSFKERGPAAAGRSSRLLTFLWTIGNIASLIGISGLFFHFAVYAGVIFIVIFVLGLVAWSRFRNN